MVYFYGHWTYENLTTTDNNDFRYDKQQSFTDMVRRPKPRDLT